VDGSIAVLDPFLLNCTNLMSFVPPPVYTLTLFSGMKCVAEGGIESLNLWSLNV